MDAHKKPIICIAGAGKIGAELMYTLSDGNNKLLWYIRSNGEKKFAKWQKRIRRAYKNNLIDENAYKNVLNNTIITDKIEDLSTIDILFEAITEELNIKNSFVTRINHILKKNVIIATTSSSILPNDFDIYKNRSAFMLGCHVFYPMNLIKHIEIIETLNTNEQTVQIIESLFVNKGFNFILQKEQTAFLINRFILNLQANLFNLCIELNISLKKAENILVAKQVVSTPVLSMIDTVGLSTIITSIENYLQIDNSKISQYDPLLKHLKFICTNSDKNFIDSFVSEIDGNERSDSPILIERFKKIYVISLHQFKNIISNESEKFLMAVDDILNFENE